MNTRNAAVLEKPRARIRVLRETFVRLALHPDFFICVAFLRLPCEAPIAFCLSLCGPVPAAFPNLLVDCLSVMDKSRAESFQPPCNPSWFIERFIRRRQVECNPDNGRQVEFLTLVADESASGRCNSETLEMCAWFHAAECRDGLQNGFASQFFNFCHSASTKCSTRFQFTIDAATCNHHAEPALTADKDVWQTALCLTACHNGSPGLIFQWNLVCLPHLENIVWLRPL